MKEKIEKIGLKIKEYYSNSKSLEKIITDKFENWKVENAKYQLSKLKKYIEQIGRFNQSLTNSQSKLNMLENKALNNNEEDPKVKENNKLISELEGLANELEKKLVKKKEVRKI